VARTGLPGQGVAGQVTERGRSVALDLLDSTGRPIRLYLDAGRIVRAGPPGEELTAGGQSTPQTLLDGDGRPVVVTLADGHVMSVGAPGAKAPGARVYLDAAQTIANVTDTPVAWTAADWDDATLSSLPGAALTLTAGRWIVTACIDWQASGANHYDRRALLYHNAAAVDKAWADTPEAIAQKLAAIINAAAGDTVSVSAYQDTGGGLNVLAGSWLSVQRVRT
jgi:hypothetical protein